MFIAPPAAGWRLDGEGSSEAGKWAEILGQIWGHREQGPGLQGPQRSHLSRQWHWGGRGSRWGMGKVPRRGLGVLHLLSLTCQKDDQTC